MKSPRVLIIAILVAGLVLASIISVNSINARKSNTVAMLFSYPNGLPCLHPCVLGIQPGFTTPNQAIEFIKMHPFTKNNPIQKTQCRDQDCLSTNLGRNSLDVQVDYASNQVTKITLLSEGINGLGFTGIKIDGTAIIWSDIQSFLGQPQMVTATGGDGGFISLAAGLYDEGWCIHARPDNSAAHPPTIPLDSQVIRIESSCTFLKQLGRMNAP